MKIVLISHFGLADGMKNSLSYFNEDATDSVIAISAYVNNVDPILELENIFNTYKGEKIIIFTDIMGGSVTQYSIPYLSKGNVFIFAGMNFPMVLQSTFMTEDTTDSEIASLEALGKESVTFVNNYNFNNFEEGDE